MVLCPKNGGPINGDNQTYKEGAKVMSIEDARGKVDNAKGKPVDEAGGLILRGLYCKECKGEIIYDYVVGIYICLGCGL